MVIMCKLIINVLNNKTLKYIIIIVGGIYEK